MKRGGWSYNSGSSQKGITGRFKCSYCGRMYKQEWTKDAHEKRCEANKK